MPSPGHPWTGSAARAQGSAPLGSRPLIRRPRRSQPRGPQPHGPPVRSGATAAAKTKGGGSRPGGGHRGSGRSSQTPAVVRSARHPRLAPRGRSRQQPHRPARRATPTRRHHCENTSLQTGCGRGPSPPRWENRPTPRETRHRRSRAGRGPTAVGRRCGRSGCSRSRRARRHPVGYRSRPAPGEPVRAHRAGRAG